MKLTKLNCLIIFFVLGFVPQIFAQRPFFDKSKDILIAQFDSKPDPDDIHAQAALGSMLAHSDLAGVNAYGVAGAYGKQGGQFIDSDQLFDMVFGNSNWTDADADRNGSVRRIANKVIPILNNGGKVWVQEAGQSNITRDWLIEVKKSVNNNVVKNNVIVVQHSEWNQNLADNTSNSPSANPVVLNYVRNNTRYFYIDDGNAPFGGFGDHGPWDTPEYRSRDRKWLNQALSSPNAKAKQLWTEAERVIAIRYPGGVPYDWSFMKNGGTDYSDCVENWWIFNIGSKADNISKFWSRYVTNTTGSNPDPDPTPCDGKVYEEKNGVAAVEAEGFVSQSKTGNRKWYLQNGSNTTPTPDPDASHHNGASDGGYLEILPDTRVTHGDPLQNGVNFSNTAGQLAIVDYKVKFNSPGKYFVWVRAHSTGTEDNGVHVGINGAWPASGQRMQWCAGKNQWTWESKQRTAANHCGEAQKIFINVPSAGVHTISFSMREDGFEMDKFVLSKAYTKPNGNGPAAILADCDNGGGGTGGDCQTISLSAISDFPNTNVSGFSPAYVDNARNALAIDASKYKDKFAAAQTTFNGDSGAYDITLNTLTETDGESTYRLVVGGTAVGTFKNPTTSTDYAPAKKVFENVTISKGSTIRVEFNSHTNGQIPEGNSTAYSRGRWTSLQFNCSEGGGTGGGGENQSPTIKITKPDQNNYNVGSNIAVQVSANDADGNITKYQVYVNNQLVDTDGANYTPHTIANVQVGNYTVKVTVTDNKGATATATKSFTVGEQPSTDINIPGSFEAEDYENKFGSIRIENTPGSSGKNLGFIKNGDYTEYNVNVESNGRYAFDISASSAGVGGIIDIVEAGNTVGSLSIPVTGQWHDYKTYTVEVPLTAGNKTIRLVYKGAAGYLFNIDKVTTTKVILVEQTVTLSPIHDAYLQASTRLNSAIVRIEQNRRLGYLMYDLSSINGTITKADLKFTVVSDPGSGNLNINKGTSHSWTESNLSNSNKPAVGALLGNINTTYAIGNTKTVSLNAGSISGNELALVLNMTNGNDFAFASKENAGNTPPQLIITYTSSSVQRNNTLVAAAKDAISDKLNVYPNPAIDWISVPGALKGSRVKIFNSIGILQKEITLKDNQNRIDVNNLTSGYYILNVFDGLKTSNIIMIKN